MINTYPNDPRVPSTEAVGALSGAYASGFHAGFVGEPNVIGITLESSWEHLGESLTPQAEVSSYETLKWGGPDYGWIPDVSHSYIDVRVEGCFGIFRLRARIGGVLADGQLTLTLANAGSGYSDVSWDWAPGAPDSEKFWKDLVLTQQLPSDLAG